MHHKSTRFKKKTKIYEQYLPLSVNMFLSFCDGPKKKRNPKNNWSVRKL